MGVAFFAAAACSRGVVRKSPLDSEQRCFSPQNDAVYWLGAGASSGATLITSVTKPSFQAVVRDITPVAALPAKNQ